MNRFGVVIPVGKGRLNNLNRVLEGLKNQTRLPDEVVIVCDGWVANLNNIDLTLNPKIISCPEKHQPGEEQPRNVGVRFLPDDCDYVWFVDSDCIPHKACLFNYEQALRINPLPRILLGPYDWGPPNLEEPNWNIRNDPRWDMFRTNSFDVVKYNDLGMGLGCLSGNLIWPIEEFNKIGGFWNELHMGRCEDGELGLRAASLGVPMSCVAGARAFHIHHEINTAMIHEKNERDVPLIHKRHGKVEKLGLKVVNEDGKRFNYVCPECEQEINTLEYWSHGCVLNRS